MALWMFLLFQNFVDVQTPIGQMGHDGFTKWRKRLQLSRKSQTVRSERCDSRIFSVRIGVEKWVLGLHWQRKQWTPLKQWCLNFKPHCRVDSFRWVWTRFNLWHFEFPWCRCPKSFSRYTQPPWLPLPALFNQVELGPCRTDDAPRGCCDVMYQSWYTVHLPPRCQHDMLYVHVSKIIQRISDWHSQMLRHTCLWEQSWSGRILEYM